MRCYNGKEEFTANKHTIVIAGKFDGVHKGHQKLIERAGLIAKENDCETCVFTFVTSPQAALSHKKSVFLLENEERKKVLEGFGVDILVEYHFTETLRNLSPERFIDEILKGQLNCIGVVVGTDFRFGKDRAGDAGFLLSYGKKHGLLIEVVEKLKDNGREISSTYVREELLKGNIEKVNDLLGFSWFAQGRIVHGTHVGHTIGFPTVNLIPGSRKLLPPNGVYSTYITIDGVKRRSITNIGSRPTFEGTFTTIETNIPGFSGNLYGKNAKVEFMSFVRPERRFSSVEELKAQIDSDIKTLGFQQ